MSSNHHPSNPKVSSTVENENSVVIDNMLDSGATNEYGTHVKALENHAAPLNNVDPLSAKREVVDTKLDNKDVSVMARHKHGDYAAGRADSSKLGVKADSLHPDENSR